MRRKSSPCMRSAQFSASDGVPTRGRSRSRGYGYLSICCRRRRCGRGRLFRRSGSGVRFSGRGCRSPLSRRRSGRYSGPRHRLCTAVRKRAPPLSCCRGICSPVRGCVSCTCRAGISARARMRFYLATWVSRARGRWCVSVLSCSFICTILPC